MKKIKALREQNNTYEMKAVFTDEMEPAMRAADAAKNTAQLIEGTVKKVNDGSKLVSDTSEAFGKVAESAQKVGTLVSEITQAEQLKDYVAELVLMVTGTTGQGKGRYQSRPDKGNAAKKGKYRILDGVHRWSAYKKTGATEIEVVIIILDQIEQILYAAKMAIGPRQQTEAETRNTARRAFQSNPRLTSSEIGRALGRSRQAVDKYIADLSKGHGCF